MTEATAAQPAPAAQEALAELAPALMAATKALVALQKRRIGPFTDPETRAIVDDAAALIDEAEHRP